MPFPLPDPYVDRDGIADGPGTQRNFDAIKAILAPGVVVGFEPGLRIIRGTIAASGAITAGSGFSSVRNSIGSYTVTFAGAFAAAGIIPTVTFGMGRTAVAVQARVTVIDNSAFTYAVFTSAGANTDSETNFIAIGPRP